MCGIPCWLWAVVLSLIVGFLVGRSGQAHHSSIPRTLAEEELWCPQVLPPMVAAGADKAVHAYQKMAVYRYGEASDVAFHPSWAGDFVVTFYLSAVHVAVALYKSRHADSIEVPKKTGDASTFRVGRVVAPDFDLDDPYYLSLEKYVPRFIFNSLFLPGFNCFMGTLRQFDFEDALADNSNNTWTSLLQNGKYKRKRDWVMTFYEPYHMLDGVAAFPPQENDFAHYYWKNDEWMDGLEKAIAFDLIGVHRVKTTSREFGGQTMAFVLPLNSMAVVTTRPGFGRFGADLYFDGDGNPLVVETPDGKQVNRGDPDWQYWKWVWRATLLSSVTLIDHLHLTHFRAANALARVTRRALPADHFFRRLLSVFTFGSIYVNHVAMHTLLGTGHVLHRSTPFEEFETLSELVPEKMPALTEWHAPILNDTVFEAMPQILRDSPYYTDGRLLVTALRNLLNNVLDIFLDQDCNEDGTLRDPHLVRFRNMLVAQDAEAGYAASVGDSVLCRDLREQMLAFLWTVTAWHRHVGTVGDYFKDPDLAGFSWKDGEAYVRPRQCMMMTVVAAFTSLPQPKLNEDFSHVFKNTHKEAEIVAAFAKFREELKSIEATVKKRNEGRQMKNYHADPSVVECSVAV